MHTHTNGVKRFGKIENTVGKTILDRMCAWVSSRFFQLKSIKMAFKKRLKLWIKQQWGKYFPPSLLFQSHLPKEIFFRQKNRGFRRGKKKSTSKNHQHAPTGIWGGGGFTNPPGTRSDMAHNTHEIGGSSCNDFACKFLASLPTPQKRPCFRSAPLVGCGGVWASRPGGRREVRARPILRRRNQSELISVRL